MFIITVRRLCSQARPEIEIADMALRDSATNQLLAATAIAIALNPRGLCWRAGSLAEADGRRSYY